MRAPRRWRGTSTSQWRRAPGLQVLGWALMPVCWWLDSSAGETTTLVHLCATRGSCKELALGEGGGRHPLATAYS